MQPVFTNDVVAPRGLHLDELALEWRGAPRRWGHPLHSLCSYFAMFPPHVPRVFIEWLTAPGIPASDHDLGRCGRRSGGAAESPEAPTEDDSLRRTAVSILR